MLETIHSREVTKTDAYLLHNLVFDGDAMKLTLSFFLSLTFIALLDKYFDVTFDVMPEESG